MRPQLDASTEPVGAELVYPELRRAPPTFNRRQKVKNEASTGANCHSERSQTRTSSAPTHCHSERSEESAFSSRHQTRHKLQRRIRQFRGNSGRLWRSRRFRRSCGLVRRRRFALRRRLANGKVLAHFFEPLRSDPTNGTQIIHAFKRAVRLAHLQNLVRSHRPNPRHQLQLLRSGRIQVDRRFRRLLIGRNTRSYCEKERKRKKKRSYGSGNHDA
jgi:hypothetical protein